MAETTKKETTAQEPKEGFFSSPAHLLVLIVIFLVLLVSGIYLSGHRTKQPVATVTTSTKTGGSLTLTVDNKTPQAGSEIKVDIWEDSGSQPTNAVEADVLCPASSFEFVGIDSSKSSFEIQARSEYEKGMVKIVRAHKGSLTGRQLVATIKLKVGDQAGSGNLTFTKDSHIVGSVGNKDLLSQSTGVNITVKASQ